MLTGLYQKNEGRLQRKTRKKYQNLSEEEKHEILQYACEQYWNISEEKKENNHQYDREQFFKIFIVCLGLLHKTFCFNFFYL